MYPKFFYLGETPEQFLADLQDARAKFEQLYAECPNLNELSSTLGKGFNSVRYVLVIAEPWSGDVLYFLPPLLKLARQFEWEVRIFRRDQYPEIILPYRKDGLYHAIPVFVFYDQDFVELGYWVERPAKATAIIDDEALKLRRVLREKNKIEWQQETVTELENLFHAHD